MPKAVPQPIRQQIVERRQAGEALTQIAADLGLSYRTVRGLWHRFRTRGAAGLAADYSRCASPGPRFPAAIVAAALALKQEHPPWGAGLIRVQLAEQFAGQRLPSQRTLQSWWRAAGLQPPRSRAPAGPPRGRGKVAHEVWQLDAKEEIRLADGSRTCSFSVVDEATGVVLGTALFSPAQSDPGAGASGAALAEGGVGPLGSSRAVASGQRLAVGQW